jgi:hypothetical protein
MIVFVLSWSWSSRKRSSPESSLQHEVSVRKSTDIEIRPKCGARMTVGIFVGCCRGCNITKGGISVPYMRVLYAGAERAEQPEEGQKDLRPPFPSLGEFLAPSQEIIDKVS